MGKKDSIKIILSLYIDTGITQSICLSIAPL